MTKRKLTEKFGALITAEPGDTLDAIATSRIRELLAHETGGVILFRGFKPTEAAFRSFTEKHGTEFVVHHNLMARDYIGDDHTFATVNKGNYAIDFHNEMASDPVSPEIFWMMACVPAKRRGRTGLVDGAIVADELTADTRALFSERPFLFQFDAVPKSLWGSLLPGRTGRAEVSEWLASVGRDRGVSEFRFDADEQLTLRYGFLAIRPTRFSGRTAFCCGILDSPDAYRFADGTKPEIPAIVEVAQAAYQNALWLDWLAGDIVVVDNTRVMHCREAFDDPQRKILVRYSGLR